nr:MAG TPA: hypothetical protein [Bacteriophage sp.]
MLLFMLGYLLVGYLLVGYLVISSYYYTYTQFVLSSS